jgi:hypothetical protein
MNENTIHIRDSQTRIRLCDGNQVERCALLDDGVKMALHYQVLPTWSVNDKAITSGIGANLLYHPANAPNENNRGLWDSLCVECLKVLRRDYDREGRRH